MNILYILYLAATLWFVQQVNDNLNAFLNRVKVPKLYWLSAGASFASGVALFYFLYALFEAIIATFDGVGNILQLIIQRIQ